jgi:hydroxymethylglutaryl-CoA synthase
MLAKDYVALHPGKIALVVASDVAWYGFNTPGEVTQGAGAIAMIVSANPRIGVIEEGLAIVESNKDFYRPSYYEVPIVDGKLSIRSYKELLKQVRPQQPLKFVCFHMPFATMSDKASEVLIQPLSEEVLRSTKAFNKEVGNIYNGSLYLSLISLLTTYPTSLANEKIGMFSYGSGATGESFSITLQPNYEKAMNKTSFLTTLSQRRKADFTTYERLMSGYEHREKSLNFTTTIPNSRHRFVLTGILNGHREYLRR